MDDRTELLGQRAVACPGWQWMDEMEASYRHPDADPDRVSGRVAGIVRPWMRAMEVPEGTPWCWVNGEREPMLDAIPDLTDPATVGCFMALVRDKHGPHCCTAYAGGFWTVQDYDTERAWGKNCVFEAEALVAALEAIAQTQGGS